MPKPDKLPVNLTAAELYRIAVETEVNEINLHRMLEEKDLTGKLFATVSEIVKLNVTIAETKKLAAKHLKAKKRLQYKLNALKVLHKDEEGICEEDNQMWPCNTFNILLSKEESYGE